MPKPRPFVRIAETGGFGILQSASFVVGPALRDGRVVELLPEWRLPDIGFYAVWPRGRFIPPRIRAVVDDLAECFAGTPPWEARAPTPLRESP
jgi:DNA-binding transcriptional LysR family regulator